MVKVVAKNKVMQDRIETVIQLYDELITATRKEDGCIKYELFQDETDATILTIIEEWENMNALDRHMRTDHFLKIVPMVGESVIDKDINIYHKVL